MTPRLLRTNIDPPLANKSVQGKALDEQTWGGAIDVARLSNIENLRIVSALMHRSSARFWGLCLGFCKGILAFGRSPSTDQLFYIDEFGVARGGYELNVSSGM